MSDRVFVLLGSNHEPEKNLAACVKLLRAQFTVLAVSPAYESPAIGGDGPNYLNAAVLLDTILTPRELKQALLNSEAALGRQRPPAGKVTIDLDLVLWSIFVFEYGEKPWRVPHPQVVKYYFAARPLADLAPDFDHPEACRPLKAIADSLPADGVVLRADVRL